MMTFPTEWKNDEKCAKPPTRCGYSWVYLSNINGPSKYLFHSGHAPFFRQALGDIPAKLSLR
jgi:hypothetical protein